MIIVFFAVHCYFLSGVSVVEWQTIEWYGIFC